MNSKTFGYKLTVPLFASEKFAVGSKVAFPYENSHHEGTIETMMNNSAVVKISQSPSKALIDYKTVISYKKLTCVE
ncbi:hypothetical protein NRIC_28450 [Enterococcus florum]|uniref:DUF2187 domain-containing protein n=1 Tax=Enterococcus florum TaxID=2480627 RepID=A0A4P5PEB5_9ENTE|nr:hypothetical protein [Enterococcus florum]GCF94954.1 hypothetical protein NRIC_28450 [Enterococcus florum]